jgi:phospholipid/cholesterol/gamma-HCH transport system permease protein
MTETKSAGAFLFRFRSWRRILRFAGHATVAVLSPSTYSPATRAVAVRQIYFTAWQILLGYTLFAALFSLVLIEIVAATARRYGLSQHALELILRVLVLELIPLLTALFVALRSGAAIGAEVALMRVSGEIEDLEGAGESPLHGEFVPRIAAAAFSVASLTTLSCALALWLAYVVIYGFSPWGYAEYTRIVGNVFDVPGLAGFALKCLLFGMAVALIPIATGLEAERGKIKSVPVAVLGGLVKLFFVIGLIEVISLVVKYV